LQARRIDPRVGGSPRSARGGRTAHQSIIHADDRSLDLLFRIRDTYIPQSGQFLSVELKRLSRPLSAVIWINSDSAEGQPNGFLIFSQTAEAKPLVCMTHRIDIPTKPKTENLILRTSHAQQQPDDFVSRKEIFRQSQMPSP
jgi:hypothetical protein